MGKSVRMGIDVGGTHTKAVAIDNATHEIIGKSSVKTTHDDPRGVAAGVVRSFENCLNENGTAAVADTASFSKFVLYRLFPILNDDELSPERKTELARSYITGLLKLQ